MNWPFDKLNSASLFIILVVGQEVEIWMSTWSFRPAAYIEWMVAVLMTKRYKWNGLNLVVLETLVLKAPWRKSSPSFSFSIMTFLRMLNKTLLWLSLSASKEHYSKISSNREIKIHVYSIRQTANVSGEFLRIENKQLKTVQNDSFGQNYHKTTYSCVEAINGKRKIGGKLGHVVQIHVCRLA